MNITLSRVTDFHNLGKLWRDLETRTDASFFQSWAWTGCLAEERFSDPVLLMAENNERICGLALFNQTRGYLGLPTLWLGETGDPSRDDIFVEHNGVLVERSFSEMLIPACLEAAQHNAIDGDTRHFPRVIRLSGIPDQHVAALRSNASAVRVRATRLAPFVDIDSLRRSGRTVLATISRNTRYQIRRSERRYATTGPLAIVRARCIEQAQHFLDELVQLHQSHWRSRGRPGAFSNPKFVRFHRTLIDRAFSSGGTDLLKVTAGDQIIGYLYNLRHHGCISSYQSGFNYRVFEPHQKPGLTCHHVAMELYFAEGAHTYDFLAGSDQYKLSFSTDAVRLHWIDVWPRSLRGTMSRNLEEISRRVLGDRRLKDDPRAAVGIL